MIPTPPDPKVLAAVKGFRDDVNRAIARRLVVEPSLRAAEHQGYLQGVLLDTAAFLTAAGERIQGKFEPAEAPSVIAQMWQQRLFYWRGALAVIPHHPSDAEKFLVDYLESLLKESTT